MSAPIRDGNSGGHTKRGDVLEVNVDIIITEFVDVIGVLLRSEDQMFLGRTPVGQCSSYRICQKYHHRLEVLLGPKTHHYVLTTSRHYLTSSPGIQHHFQVCPGPERAVQDVVGVTM